MRTMFVGGSPLIAAGLALMATMASVDDGYLSVLPGLLVLAVGVGLTMTPGTTAITGSLPVDEQGVASALNDTVRELGGAIGVALIGSVLSAAYSSSVADATAGLPPEVATVGRGGHRRRRRRAAAARAGRARRSSTPPAPPSSTAGRCRCGSAPASPSPPPSSPWCGRRAAARRRPPAT